MWQACGNAKWPFFISTPGPWRGTRNSRWRRDGSASRQAHSHPASIMPPPLPPPLLSDNFRVIVTCAEPERLMSEFDTALTFTVVEEGTMIGAVYKPVVEMVPTAEQ
jgi:hypothetical protein